MSFRGGYECGFGKRTFIALDGWQTVGTRRSERLLREATGVDEFDWESGVGGERHGCC